MIHTPIHTTLLTDISKAQGILGIFEILEKNDLSYLIELGISSSAQEIIFSHLKKEKKKPLHFYEKIGGFSEITIFFPEKNSLLQDRSDFFQSLSESCAFIPTKNDVSGAYEALTLATYRFQKYLSKKEEFSIFLLVSEEEKNSLEQKTPLYEAIIWARDMINTPPQDSNPEKIIAEIQAREWKNFDVEIFGKQDLQKLGCNLLLAVGAGSKNPPYMVVLRPKNPPKTEKYAIIGKGVTFDAGGIQIKPDKAMLDMKSDMSGAAGALGVAQYLDSLDALPVDITIAVGLTENMTGDDAYKPLDIYRAFNGLTVEIHHTDAEGRLVLADVMSYVEKTYNVDHIITMATLTGACVYALGSDIAGIMGDDETVISTLIDTKSPYEKVWRLPLTEKIKKALKTDIADLKNISTAEKAGSSLGGAFLSYFQGNAKLTHLDIAGPAYRETVFGYMPKGGTGWGVKILSEFLVGKK